MPELYEYALQPEHRRSISDESVDQTTITYTGALSVNSGNKKGRVPKEKRTVLDETTKDVSRESLFFSNVLFSFRPFGGEK